MAGNLGVLNRDTTRRCAEVSTRAAASLLGKQRPANTELDELVARTFAAAAGAAAATAAAEGTAALLDGEGGAHKDPDILGFQEFWDRCHDDVEIALYLENTLSCSGRKVVLSHREVVVDTSAFLEASALMADEGSEGEAKGSGIHGADRPPLWSRTVRSIVRVPWMEQQLVNVRVGDHALPVLKNLNAREVPALPVCSNSDGGVCVCFCVLLLLLLPFSFRVVLCVACTPNSLAHTPFPSAGTSASSTTTPS